MSNSGPGSQTSPSSQSTPGTPPSPDTPQNSIPSNIAKSSKPAVQSTTHNTPQPRPGARAWIAWTLAVLFVVWLFNIQTGFAILKESVQQDLTLSVSQIGLIASIYTWVFAFCQLFAGALLDKLGSRKVLVPSIFLVGLGAFLFGSAQSFTMLAIAQAVLALGACTGFVGAGYVGGVWFGMARFGAMFGLVQVVAALSSAFGQAGFDAALAVTDWRGLMIGFAIFGIALLAFAIPLLRNPVAPNSISNTNNTNNPEKTTATSLITGVFANVLEAARNREVILVALNCAITFGMQLALGVVWMPNIARAHGISDTMAAMTSAALWLGLAAGSAVINPWTDRIRSRKRPLVITTAVMLVALLGMLVLPLNAPLAIALAAIFGAANGGHMLAFTIAGDNVPERLIGTASSVVNGAMFLAGGVIIAIPASMLEGTAELLADYQRPLVAYAALMVVAVVLAALVKESHPARRV